MNRLTKRLEDGQAIFHECHGTCGTCDGANCYCIGPMVDRLAAYEDFMDRWHLKSIEDAERIFRRVNDLGGTDLMAQYRELGSINHLRDLLQAEKAGRLVVLPCKVGDRVWVTRAYGKQFDAPREGHVRKFVVHDDDLVFLEALIWIDFGEGKKEYGYRTESFGKIVHLTREEAEAALGGKGGEGNA